MKRYGEARNPLEAESLTRLQKAARERKNVFEELMQAVKFNSLGQISHALYEVGGSIGGTCNHGSRDQPTSPPSRQRPPVCHPGEGPQVVIPAQAGIQCPLCHHLSGRKRPMSEITVSSKLPLNADSPHVRPMCRSTATPTPLNAVAIYRHE